MKLKLEITMDNAAFSDGNNGSEASRILRDFAGKIDGDEIVPGNGSRFQDINGNTCGTWKVTK
jgi:hypothetical protein